MEIRKLFADDNAVSPVIGVILMVAITVILAAVIGTFVLGLGDQVQTTAPKASFAFDFTDNAAGTADELAITHDGGDSITAGNIDIKASGVISDGAATPTTETSLGWETLSGGAAEDDVSAGSTVTAYGESGGNDDLADDSVRVVWASQDGSTSATLGKWSGPDA